MKLRIRPSYIRTVGEPIPERRRRRQLGRWVYLALLFVAITLLLARFARSQLYVQGMGQLEIARLNVQELSDIRILGLLVREGQEVRRGDVLFTYSRVAGIATPAVPAGWERSAARTVPAGTDLKRRLRRIELEQVETRLAESRRRVEELRGLQLLKSATVADVDAARRSLAQLQSQRDRLAAELAQLAAQGAAASRVAASGVPLALDVQSRDAGAITEFWVTASRPFAAAFSLNGDSLELATRLTGSRPVLAAEDLGTPLVRGASWERRPGGWTAVWPLAGPCEVVAGWELRAPYRLMLQLRAAPTTRAPSGPQPVELRPVTGEIFRSPFSGMVTRIFFEDFEVALTGEVIMNIYTPRDVHIKVFFEQEDARYLVRDQPVTLEFPDGTECSGKITRLYYAALPHPPEFQKKYEPTHRSVVADVVPVGYQLPAYLGVDKMSVRVFFRRKIL